MNQTTFLLSVKIGDVLYAIPGMRQVCKRRRTKARLYLRTNVKTINSIAGLHPFEEIMLTDEGLAHLKPLLMVQDFIEDVREFHGEPIDFNLDLIRQMKIGIPFGDLKRWYSYAFPEMATSYDDVWLQFKPDPKTSAIATDAIIITVTNNYRNHWINYDFLNVFHTSTPIYFIGHEDEAQAFVNIVPRTQWLKCDNFNDITAALSSCKVFIGNQSAVFAVAEGLKIPRILEIFPMAPNVIPCGKGGYDFHNQGALEYYLKELLP